MPGDATWHRNDLFNAVDLLNNASSCVAPRRAVGTGGCRVDMRMYGRPLEPMRLIAWSTHDWIDWLLIDASSRCDESLIADVFDCGRIVQSRTSHWNVAELNV